MDLTDLSLTEAVVEMETGQVSAVELTRACLARVEALDAHLNCFITLTADRAMEQAVEADALRSQGENLGRLHGVPLALKDLFYTAGVQTTAGSPFLADFVPDRDAYVVQQLIAAGAVSLGKLNMHEWAFGVTNENPHYGACRNPWDPTRMTGGSSGGSGAALAARFCPGALGSDTGGSIRIPASLCGVVGLKPTYGRVSLQGVVPLSWHLDHVGPMARRVRDVALLYQVMAGNDPADSSSLEMPVEDALSSIEGGVKGWRVALAHEGHFSTAAGDVLAAIQSAAQVFESLGAQVIPVKFKGGRKALEANLFMLLSDAAAYHRDRLQESPEKFGEDVRERLQEGAAHLAMDYVRVRRHQRELRHQFVQFFTDFDLLLTPTTPVTAPQLEAKDPLERAPQLTRFTAPFNLTGLPAISVPGGFDQRGMPIGLQLITSPWEEARLLQAASSFERATEWHLSKPPPLFFPRV